MDNVKTGKVKHIKFGDGITSSANSFYIDIISGETMEVNHISLL